MKSWKYDGLVYRNATGKEYQKALEKIADEIIRYGYEVTGVSQELDCMDIWGFQQSSGKRRRKCFLEIYANLPVVTDDRVVSVVFSHPNYETEDCIEVLFDSEGIPNVSDLVTGIIEIIQPIKKRGKK